MFRQLAVIGGVSLLAAGGALSQSLALNPNNALVLQPQSRLWVAGTSTVRSYECTAKGVNARVATLGDAAASAVLNGEKAVTSVVVTVATQRLDCGDGTMNDHMLKALKATQHPEITFRLGTYELIGSGDATRVRLNGTLSLGGESRPVAIEAAAKADGAAGLRVTGRHELKMSEYGLRAPTLMLGTLRVHDGVVVNFDLYLRS
jgi:polyisoprenoid-binding protein YceI